MSEEKVEEYQGVVVWFDPRKGFGFVAPDNKDTDVFVHYSNLEVEGFKTLKPNQIVTYELGSNHHGQQCVNVKVVGEVEVEEQE